MTKERYYPPGLFPYRTISFRSKLCLESSGNAKFSRRQRIRFLEDGISVFIDRIWGDGVLADYRVGSGARAVDTITANKGVAVVLALPRTFGKGEVFEIETDRRIIGAFTEPDAYAETIMPTPTEALDVEVIAPPDRKIGDADVIVPSIWGVEARQTGKLLRLRATEVHLNSPYRLAWQWQ